MMLLSTDWAGGYGLPADIVKGVTAVSGIYDLAPLPYTFLQPQLQLGWDQVRRNSPIEHIPQSAPPLLISYGSKEPTEFARQSEEYLAAWRAQGLDGELLVLPDKNHYDVIDGFLNPESLLCSSVLARMGVE
jgi:arylformamidase